jgi:Guanylate kinase
MKTSKLLVIAGPSGSGKNYITDALVREHPGLFEQLPQVTTRPKRSPEENTYYFIDDMKYDDMKDTLIAKTKIGESRYGTIPGMKGDSIGIIIANRMGIESLEEDLNDPTNNVDFDVFYLGIDSVRPAKREGRDDEYVMAERELLQGVVGDWLYNTEERWLEAADVVSYLIKKKFIEAK